MNHIAGLWSLQGSVNYDKHIRLLKQSFASGLKLQQHSHGFVASSGFLQKLEGNQSWLAVSGNLYSNLRDLNSPDAASVIRHTAMDGDFCLSFVNPTKNRVFLRRDLVGLRPLYYAYQQNTFYWSTDLSALTELASDLKSVRQNICELEPGQVVRFSDRGLKKLFAEAWRVGSNPRCRSYVEACDNLSYLFNRAIKLRDRSNDGVLLDDLGVRELLSLPDGILDLVWQGQLMKFAKAMAQVKSMMSESEFKDLKKKFTRLSMASVLSFVSTGRASFYQQGILSHLEGLRQKAQRQSEIAWRLGYEFSFPFLGKEIIQLLLDIPGEYLYYEGRPMALQTEGLRRSLRDLNSGPAPSVSTHQAVEFLQEL